jgi:serine protease Do
LSKVNLTKPNINFRSRRWGIVVIILLAGLAGYAGSWLQTNHASNNLSTNTSAQKKIVTSESALINQIAKTVGPSVVSVNVEITSGNTDFFGNSQPAAQAAGTGIIIDANGTIITNRHVVPAGTTKVSVTLSDGTEFKDVDVIGRTNDSDSLDVAFLKIKDTKDHKLVPAVLGNSSEVLVGDNVVAIGNALGQFQNTVTSGIISGYGRSVTAGDSSGQSSSTENLVNLFQTDAAINEGNSGGPLVNMNSQVIGINTAIAGNAQNIGFSIPINDISGMINQVLKTGKFARPYLGIRYVSLTPDIADQLDLSQTNGAYIGESSDPSSPSIIPDGPGEKAGLQQRDTIVAVDDTKIDQTHSLSSLLGTHQPGDKVKLTVVRDGKTLHISATLGTMPTS